MAPPHHSRDKGHVRHGRMITERNRGNTLTGPKGLCSLANIAPRCGKVFHSALRCIARSSVASLPSRAKPELRPLAVTAALAQQPSEQTRRRWTALTGVLQHHQTAPVVSRTHAVRETMMVFLEKRQASPAQVFDRYIHQTRNPSRHVKKRTPESDINRPNSHPATTTLPISSSSP